jgi:hypothetical protein
MTRRRFQHGLAHGLAGQKARHLRQVADPQAPAQHHLALIRRIFPRQDA